MSTELSRFQDGVVQALLAPHDAAPDHLRALTDQPGFAVYRNTVLKGCIDALQANFPAVVRLVGEEWFRAVAALHARAQPPGDTRRLRICPTCMASPCSTASGQRRMWLLTP